MKAMSERPILFSGPMVRAILDGHKTQTRRIVKRQPVGEWAAPGRTACPYGVPGDRLWVRETFASSQKCLVAYRADGECGAWMGDGGGGRIWNRHGGIVGAEFHRSEDWRGQTLGLSRFGGQWKPSIHMPRWASRLTLQVTEVRVQRLQDISEEDAKAEGVDAVEDGELLPDGSGSMEWSYWLGFRRLWDSINAKRGHSWESNPYVWAISFKVLP